MQLGNLNNAWVSAHSTVLNTYTHIIYKNATINRLYIYIDTHIDTYIQVDADIKITQITYRCKGTVREYYSLNPRPGIESPNP